MKNTGMVRKIDELGRIVLPKELRKVLNIGEKDPIEIYTEGNSIILTKHESCCVFCGRTQDDSELKSFEDKIVCKCCADGIARIFQV
jgi:transcriptional pleiotropic regulator of transition state genes